MATITLLPDGDNGVPEWTPKGGGDNYVEVDEGVAGHDSDTTENTTSDDADEDKFSLENVPGDFDTAVDYQIKAVAKQDGRVDDQAILKSDILGTGDLVESFSLDAATTYTTFNGAVRSNTDSLTAWNGYLIRYTAQKIVSGMPDAITWFATAVEVVINYDTTVGAVNVSRRLLRGVGV